MRCRIVSVHRATGFTLVELLVVMVIVSLLVAVLPPLVLNTMPGVELKSATRQLASALRFARSQAITRNHSVVLQLDVEDGQYWIPELKQPASLPDDLDLELFGSASEAVDHTSGGIRFYPDGSSTGGRITLARGTRSYELEVDWLLGSVTVHD